MIIALLSFLQLRAQGNAVDSVGKVRNLDEVVVKANLQTLSVGKATAIPTKSQKDAARDAVSLLGLLAMPQLDVNPMSESVTTPTGEGVAMFIDYAPASQEQLKGLRTQDVKRVEYMQHPEDPRFQNARYVVNFVMRKYKVGGYTKLNASKSFGVNRTEGFLYSMMQYKAMVYDIFARENYLTTRHNGYSATEYFRFTDLFGEGPKNVTRLSRAESSRFQTNTNDFSFRALYATQNTRVQNTVGINLYNNPKNDNWNLLEYNTSLFPNSTSTTDASARNLTLNYDGNFFQTLPKQFSLSAYANFKYGHNSSNSLYNSGAGLDILNDAKERIYNGTFAPNLTKRVGDHHSFTLFGSGRWNYNRIVYTGDSPSVQHYHVADYNGGLSYFMYFEKVQAGGQIAWEWQRNSIGGVQQNMSHPQFSVYANFQPMQKAQISLAYNYGEETPTLSEKSPNMLRQDEILWYEGTPTLKNAVTQNANINYTWYISSKWQLSATAAYYWLTDRRVSRYAPDGPDGTMLRKYINSGDYQNGYLGIYATAKFFDSRLVVKLSPLLDYYKTTGICSWKRTQLSYRGSVSYNFGKFYVNGYYRSGSKYPEEQSGMLDKRLAEYQIQFGWGNGKWNLNFSADNFARYNWKSMTQTLRGDYYSMHREVFTIDRHAKFTLSATYTFNYGKKVNSDYEVGGTGAAESAILK